MYTVTLFFGDILFCNVLLLCLLITEDGNSLFVKCPLKECNNRFCAQRFVGKLYQLV